MKKRLGILILVSLAGCAMVGCSSQQSDLSKDEKAQMDKLFREGIKPPSTPGATPQRGGATGGQGGPLNPETG